ncbi:MAG: hypothetical protein V2A79_09930 [Planctomycetota bacterium]
MSGFQNAPHITEWKAGMLVERNETSYRVLSVRADGVALLLAIDCICRPLELRPSDLHGAMRADISNYHLLE